MDKPVEMIVACTAKGEIGFQGTIPWELTGDLKRFKELTMGNVVIMGRKTVESLPRRLEGRVVIMVAKDFTERLNSDKLDEKDLELLKKIDYAVGDLPAAIEAGNCDKIGGGASIFSPCKKIFIAGGAGIYAEAMTFVDTIWLSMVLGRPDTPDNIKYDAVIPNFDELLRNFEPNIFHLTVTCPTVVENTVKANTTYYLPMLFHRKQK